MDPAGLSPIQPLPPSSPLPHFARVLVESPCPYFALKATLADSFKIDELLLE